MATSGMLLRGGVFNLQKVTGVYLLYQKRTSSSSSPTSSSLSSCSLSFSSSSIPSCSLSSSFSSSSTARVESSSDENVQKLKHFSEIPGPKHYPIIGCMPAIIFGKDPKFDITKMNDFWKAMVKKHGNIFAMKFPGNPDMVGIHDVNDFPKVFRETMDNPVRTGFDSYRKVRYEAKDNFFEKKGGLLIENNEEWWRVRSKVQTPMMKMKNIARYLPQLDQVNLLLMDRISSYQQQYGEMPADFIEDLYKWALESVGLVALNRRLGCFEPNLPTNSISKELIENVNVMFEALSDTELNVKYWMLYETKSMKMLKKAHNTFLDIVLDLIQETERNFENSSLGEDAPLLEIFLKTDGLSRKDVVTIILDMFFAGIDTTSHTVAFTLYCLSRNKEAQKRLQAELDSVLGDVKEPITDVHLAKLSFLKSCVKESMRLFPITPGNVRMLTKDMELSGYLIPKGVLVFMLGSVTSTSEDYFTRPTEYLPERWQRDQPLGKIHPFASIPFSHGSRMCIGRRIAEQEIYSLLARVFQRFHVDYKYEDIGYVTRLISVPSKPLKFEFTERNK